MISFLVALMLMFAVGLTVFRQTKAIWSMTSSNAVTMNNTLNVLGGGFEYIIIPIVIIVAFVGLAYCTRLGFG